MVQIAANSHRVARAAAARGTVAHLVKRSGRALAAGAGIGLALVVAAKFFPSTLLGSVHWGFLLAIPAGAAGVGSLVWTAARRWAVLRGAAEVDRALGLKDAITAAITLGSNPADPAFVSLAVRDAERVTAGINVRRAIAVRFDRWWGVWPAIGAAGVSLGLFLPPMTRTDRTARPKDTIQQREQTAAEIRRAAEVAREVAGPEPESQGPKGELADLARVEQELSRGEVGSREARAQAARALEEAAAKVEREGEKQGEANDALRRAMAKAARSADGEAGKTPSGPVGPLSDALEQGDIEAAAAAARELAESAERMSDPERKRAAEELLEMSRRLDEAAAQTERERAAREDALKREQGELTSPQSNADPAASSPPDAKQGESPVAKQAETKPTDTADRADSQSKQAEPQPPAQQENKQPDAKGDKSTSNGGDTRTSRNDPVDPKVAERAEKTERERKSGADKTGESKPQQGDGKDETSPLKSMREALREAAEQMKRGGQREKDNTGQDAARKDPKPAPADGEKSKSQTPDQERQGEAKRDEGMPGDKSQADQKQPDGASNSGAPKQAEQAGEKQAQDPNSKGQGTDPSGKQSAESKDSKGAHDSTSGRPGDKAGSKRSDTDGKQPGNQKASDQAGEKADKSGTTGEQKVSPGDSKSGAEKSSPRDTTGAENSGTKPGEAPGARPDPNTPASGENAGEKVGGERRTDGNGPAPEPSDVRGMERVARELEQLSKSGRDSDAARRKAAALRRQARDLLDRGADERGEPGGRGQAEQRSEGFAAGDAPHNGPRRAPTTQWDGKSELVDARSKDRPTGGRAIGETERQSVPRDAQPGSGDVLVERVREAAAGAERAVEQQTVPPQIGPYVKRVFRRYVERTTPPPAKPLVPDAPDAKPK